MLISTVTNASGWSRCAGERTSVYEVSLLDVTPAGPLPIETRQLLDTYRRWFGASPLARSEPRLLPAGCTRGSRRSASTWRLRWN